MSLLSCIAVAAPVKALSGEARRHDLSFIEEH